MSNDMSELRERMLSRGREARFRDMAINGLVLVAFVLILGCIAFLFWHQTIP